ncbi:MAG: YdcH family protein [Sterolibacterium sp.]
MLPTDNPEELRARLLELTTEHRDLDVAIAQLMDTPPMDELLLRRMKKRKLHLKDRIAQIERQLDPDVPA